MTPEQQKEQFSFAYVRAIAAAAQMVVTKPDVDHDSIDLNFQHKGGGGSIRSPRLEAQVKCTAAASLTTAHLAFPLEIKNYDELRPVDILVPRILIVVAVPDDMLDWVQHSESELVIRRCGYWLSLRGALDTTNTTSVTVHLPRTNQFNVAALQGMMQRIGNRQLP